MNENPPYVSKELLDYLRETCPNRCPELGDNERTIWRNAGRRSVVEELEAIYEEQEAAALENVRTN